MRQRTMLILSFKSPDERIPDQRVSLARVKAMKAQEAQASNNAPGQSTTFWTLPATAWKNKDSLREKKGRLTEICLSA